MTNKDILEKNGGKKIDICLMNPPYDNGLHLKFLKKISEISNKIVSIQPCNWLFLQSTRRVTKEVRELVDKYYTEIEVYDGPNTMKLFDGDVASKTNISINYIDITRKDNTILIDGLRDCNIKSKYNSIDDVKLFGQDKIWNSLYKKLVDNNEEKLESHANVYKHLPGIIAYFQKVGHVVDKDNVKEFEGKWVVNHGTIIGDIRKGVYEDAFFCLIGRGSKYIKPYKFEEIKDELKCFYIFDTKEEAQNFIDYIKTDLFRSIIYMTKLGQASIVADQYCPWQDFKQKWTDERLFKKYNITKEEQDRIRKVLPDYYGIRDKK